MKDFIIITVIMFVITLISNELHEQIRIIDFVILSFVMFSRLDLLNKGDK